MSSLPVCVAFHGFPVVEQIKLLPSSRDRWLSEELQYGTGRVFNYAYINQGTPHTRVKMTYIFVYFCIISCLLFVRG